MTGRIRRSTVVVLVTLGITAVGGWSAKASCPALDTACQVGEVVVAGGSLAGDATDPVDDPVEDAIAPVVETVDPVVDDVVHKVEDLLGGSPVDPPDPIGGGGGGSHGGGVPPIGGDPRGAGGRVLDGPGLSSPAGTSVGAPSGATPDTPIDRTSGGDFGAALGGVARSLAIVAALFGLAVAFVTIQDRLDRSDPRLAIAPVESDLVEFA